MGKKKPKEPQYALEKIISHRITKQTEDSITYQSIEILVKWEGYAACDNTWEPLTSIYFDIKALTRRYFKEKGYELVCKLIYITILDDTKVPLIRRFSLVPLPRVATRKNTEKLIKIKRNKRIRNNAGKIQIQDN